MNDERREELKNILDTLSLTASKLQTIKREETENRDKTPRSYHGTENYEISCNVIFELKESYRLIYELIDFMESAYSMANGIIPIVHPWIDTSD